MKILQINTVYGEGSTGNIVKDIHDACVRHGIECLSSYRCTSKGQAKLEDTFEISSPLDSRIHGFLARLTMFKGCFSILRTMRFIKKIDFYSPDLIHLHNLHGSFVNLPLLFWYIKYKNIPIVWTLHDCWAFTAICSHFTIANCGKWKSKCSHCPQRKKISISPIDNSGAVWRLKKKCFSGISNAMIVTPSRWLEELVKNSFLKEYSVETINNGINLDIFKPTVSDFRKKYNIEDKKIVLGVAFGWGYEKGLDVIVELASRLTDEYKIVLVGTDSDIDAHLPKNILSIHRTNNQRELAEIYTSSDVFINPTREEVFGLVNIESLACGTPVIVFRTGGCPECIDNTCGVTVDADNIDAMEKEIVRICTTYPYKEENCVRRASLFDKHLSLEKYIELYENMLD